MKRIPIILVAAAACFCGCTKEENPCDASGVFETTEVIVCAKSQGEILHLGADEGDLVRPGDTLACIDVQQLEWQRRQLQAGRQANDARRLDLTRQIDAVRRVMLQRAALTDVGVEVGVMAGIDPAAVAD